MVIFIIFYKIITLAQPQNNFGPTCSSVTDHSHFDRDRSHPIVTIQTCPSPTIYRQRPTVLRAHLHWLHERPVPVGTHRASQINHTKSSRCCRCLCAGLLHTTSSTLTVLSVDMADAPVPAQLEPSLSAASQRHLVISALAPILIKSQLGATPKNHSIRKRPTMSAFVFRQHNMCAGPVVLSLTPVRP